MVQVAKVRCVAAFSSDPVWTDGAEGHQQEQLVPAQSSVWEHQAALEERVSGGLSGGTYKRQGTFSDTTCSIIARFFWPRVK